MTAVCRVCFVEVKPTRHLDDIELMRLMAGHRCDVAEPWRFVPWSAVNCEDCGRVWPEGLHLTEGLAHGEVCDAVERICVECGNDIASEGIGSASTASKRSTPPTLSSTGERP